MRQRRTFAVRRSATAMLVLLVLLGARTTRDASAEAGGASSQQELGRLFAEAYTQRNTKAIAALAFWPRGPENKTDRESFNQSMDFFFMGEAETIAKVDIVPVPKDMLLSYSIKGVRYAPPLPPVGQIKATLQGTPGSTGNVQILIGEHQGRYYLDLGLPSEPVSVTEPAGKGAFHVTLGTNAASYSVRIKLNGVPVPTITGGASQAVTIWVTDSPTPDLACLRRGRNTIEIRYDQTDPAKTPWSLDFYMKSVGYTRDVFLFEPAPQKSGTITTDFEIYEKMPPGFQTRRLGTR